MNFKSLLRIIGCAITIALLFICQFALIDYIDEKEITERLCSQKRFLTIGDEINCEELLEGSSYDVSELLWTSDEESVVLNEDIFICVSSGECVVEARYKKKLVASCKVSVSAHSVILTDTKYILIGEGLTCEINANVSGENQSLLRYASENPYIVSVDEKGAITGVAGGGSRVRIDAYGCDSVYVDVSVAAQPSVVMLSEKEINLGVGQTSVVSATLPEDSYKEIAPKFTSDNDNVATVDDNGKINAVGKGECTITATAYSGASAECVVKVGEEPKSISVSVKDDSLYAGESTAIDVELNKGAFCGDYIYTSSDPSVAEVSDNGIITGKGRGKAVITVSTYNGKKDTCSVSVQIFDYMTSPTSQDIYDAVKYLADFYPEIIKTEVIGKSVKGKDITLLKLGKGNKKACVVAGLHAKEDIAVVFTMRCIEEYAAAYSSESGKFGAYNMKNLLGEYTLYIIPLMNPDGLDICNAGEMPLYTDALSDEIREKYKSNANGVNLNRNFPFRWDQIISSPTTPDEASYRGDAENSEPETQAIVKLVEENDFEWLFSMHCKGYFVYWADCYNEITQLDRKLSNRLESACGFELCGATPLKNLGGGLENWFRDKTGNPGFCVELVGPKYNSEVNEYFSLKTNWAKTKYTFIQGMR